VLDNAIFVLCPIPKKLHINVINRFIYIQKNITFKDEQFYFCKSRKRYGNNNMFSYLRLLCDYEIGKNVLDNLRIII